MIDCSKTKNYLKEKARLCKSSSVCDECPFYNFHKELPCEFRRVEIEGHNAEEAISIVQKWSDEHPQKTYKDDFYEKFPNAPTEADGTPKCCCKNIYNKAGHDYCLHRREECYKCWNEVMPE